jgi:hypothetical protein
MKRAAPETALEDHYSTSQAARLCGCTPGHLRNLRATGGGKGPRWKVTKDGTIRYPASAIREYLGESA